MAIWIAVEPVRIYYTITICCISAAKIHPKFFFHFQIIIRLLHISRKENKNKFCVIYTLRQCYTNQLATTIFVPGNIIVPFNSNMQTRKFET